MVLETKWNQKYLEQGTETLDMMQIDLELKEIKRRLREQDVLKAREELLLKSIDVEAIRIDEITNRKFCFFKDPNDQPLELYEI
jgi:hypothetical protein